jgi:putative ABC transport system permease protein
VVVVTPADLPAAARVIDSVPRRRPRPRVRLTPRRIRAIVAACTIVAVASLAGLLLSLRGSTPAGPADLVTVLPRSGGAGTLTMADAAALADSTVVPDANAVAPIVQSGGETVTAGGHRATTTLTGSTAGWMAVMHRALAQGTPLTAAQVTSGARVVVLGSFIAEALFPGGNAVGKTVQIRATPLTVAAVLSPPASGSSGLDDVTVVPITTAQGLVSGAGRVDRILLTAPTTDAVYSAYQEVNSLLLQTHHSSNPFAADFTVNTDAPDGSHTLLRLALGALVLLAVAIGAVTVRSSRRGA